MAVDRIHLRKLLMLMFLPDNRRRSELRKDIRGDLAREAGTEGAGGDIFSAAITELRKERLIPRYDYDLANVTMDEGLLFKQANSSNDFACEIMISLSNEAAEYTQELIAILDGLTWSVRSILEKVSPIEEIAIRRRIKQILMLLRGNDVWVYHTHVFRRLPERHTPLPEGEHADLSSCFIIALAAPADWGETSIRVPIDHGQPFILPAWDLDKKGGKG